MADKTKIEWADATANYCNGCSVLSKGCIRCYAMRLAGTRMKNHPTRVGLTQPSKAGPVWTGEVRANDKVLGEVLGWKRPRRIFWNAHGDLFHENVPDAWIDRQFAVMALTPQHIHMVLTKRPERMREYLTARNGMGNAAICKAINEIPAHLGNRHGALGMPLPNVWLGTSVEDQASADERIPHLLATPAAVRFLSCEPLLGPVDLTDVSMRVAEDGFPEHSGLVGCDALTGVHWDCEDTIVGLYGNPDHRIDWVIAGGESGPGARPMHPDWARGLRDQCAAAGVPFFFKQWGDWAPICELGDTDDLYHPAPERDPEATRRCKVDACVLHADGERFDREAMSSRGAFWQGKRAMTMFAVGKAKAGRLLDGVEHNGMPASPPKGKNP